MTKIEIIYEDNHLLVVNKPIGMLVQPDQGASPSLEEELKKYLREAYNKPGEAFLGVVHRIDRPTSGIVVFAKTSKALTRLNEQLRNKGFQKEYIALVENPLPKAHDHLVGYLSRSAKTNKSYLSNTPKPESKRAELKYSTLGATKNYFGVIVELLTGRHHQIRAQLSSIGCPIKGDLKYGAKRSNDYGGIALHSYRLTLTHPTTKQSLVFVAPAPAQEKAWEAVKQHLPQPRLTDQ